MAQTPVVHLYEDRRKSGKVYFRLHWKQSGEKRRECYPSRMMAEKRAMEITEELKEGRENPIPPAKAVVLEDLRHEVETKTGIPFFQFVRDALAAWQPSTKSESLEAIFDAYQLAKADLSARHQADIAQRVGAFCKKFKDRWITSILRDEIVYWIASTQTHSRTRNNYLTGIKSFLNWCKEEEYIKVNQLDSAKQWKRKEETEVKLLDSMNLKKIMDGALVREDASELVLTIALLAYGGLRVEEFKRLTWKDLQFDSTGKLLAVSVNKDKAKTATRRNIDASAELRELSKLFPEIKQSGSLTSYKYPERIIRRRIAEKLGIVWPPNCLRHSFITHTLRRTGDINRLALDAGNSPAMIQANYKGLSTKEEADAWFAVPFQIGKLS